MQPGEREGEENGMALQSVQGLPWWGGVDQSQSSLGATPNSVIKHTFSEHPNEVAGIAAALPPPGFLHPCSSHQAMAQSLAQGQNGSLAATVLPSSSGCEENQHLFLATCSGMLQSQGDYVSPLTHLELSQSMVRAAYPYADPYFGGMVAAYGAQAVLPSHMLGIQQARMPLPSEMTEEEPVYVNAKQYNGILRRRQCRAKAESENKLVKSRKPYLHESRHLHAMRRARGCGGRFLNTKNKDEAKTNSSTVSEGQSFQEHTLANSSDSLKNKSLVRSQNEDYGTKQGFTNHLMVGMGQSVSGGGGSYCSEKLVQSGHPIMSSGVSFGT